jgi:quinol monooxygenase YgiN
MILGLTLGCALTSSAVDSEAQPVVRPPDPARFLSVLAHVDVTAEHTSQAIVAIRTYVEAARREPGAVRVDAMQEIRPNHFDIIEVWRDDAAYQAHEASKATICFHEAIGPWRASPFEERLGSLLD